MSHIQNYNIELIKLAGKGDRQAQEKLIENNMGLIGNIIKRFNNRGYDAEELFQVGAIGLIKAVQKFNPEFNVKFSTYAVPMIIGEIKRFLRDDGIIKVSRSLKEMSNKAKITKDILSKELGREPTIGEISERIGISPEELAVAIDAGYSPEYLHSSVYEGGSNSILLIDKVNANEEEEGEIVDKLVLSQILDNLDERDKKIIILRYFKEKTQTQVAQIMGISQVQVSRIEKKIIEQFRKQIQIY